MAITPEDRVREVIATPKTPRTPVTKPTSSVPTMPPAMQPKPAAKAAPAATNTMGQQGGLPAGVVAGVSGAPAYNDNSTTSNVDDQTGDDTQDQSDSDIQKGEDKKDTADAFDVKQYTKAYLDKMTEAEKTADRQSAFNILKMEFQQYGLGSLVDSIKNLLTDGTPPAEFALRLRETPEYQARFKGNEYRIAKGLSALSPAEYVALEDQYQNVMRNYDLPESYYTKDTTGKQPGFEQLIANDVSASELEDRVMTAKNRVINANPEVTKALKAFYPDITDGDILAYTLDPSKGLDMIKRKVTAAEIGGAALAQGLTTAAATAENLAKYGITAAQAKEGYQNIANILPRASELSSIYNQDAYTQANAESEQFGTPGAAQATQKRKKLTALEQASFSGQSGVGALGRDRALYGQAYGQAGQY